MKTKVVNDKRCLSIVNRKLYIILLFAATLFTGCKTDTPVDNPDDPSNPETPVNVIMQNVALTGIVKDASGIPLSDMKVTTGSLNATTGGDGTFTFDQAGTVDDRAVVKFEKSGYFPLTRSGDKQDEMYIEAMLYRKGNDSISLQTDFDAAKGKRLQFKGITIDFPANCMAKADGSAYSGTVRVDVLYLNTANERAGQLMPGGDLLCIAADKSKKMLLTKGMMNVELTDNNGNPLKIKAKTDIPISFPAPPGVTAATVPLRTFDEAKGIWKEEGLLTKQGNVYSGTVSHFTYYDFPTPDEYDWYYHDIHAETVCGEPAVGAIIGGFFTGYIDDDFRYYLPNITYQTNAQGNCRIAMPIDEEGYFHASLRAFYDDQIETAFIDLDKEPSDPLNFTFNVECITVKINVTVCDKPKSGVQVQVQSGVPVPGGNIPIIGNFKSMTTDAAGNCTTQVTKGAQVNVVATHNGKEQKYSLKAEYNNSTVYFSFDDGCEDQIPEVFAVKYDIMYDKYSEYGEYWWSIMSWDNYGQRWRYDGYTAGNYGFDSVTIDIYDHLTNRYYGIQGTELAGSVERTEALQSIKPEDWDVRNIESGDDESLLLKGSSSGFMITQRYVGGEIHQWTGITGYTKRSATEMILGKPCNVWENPSSGGVIWEWKNVILRETINGEVRQQAVKITENVPTSAFTNQTGIPSWIE